MAPWNSTKDMHVERPELVAKIMPRALGWFPTGPTAPVLAAFKRPGTEKPWPPAGVKLVEITSEAAAVCMGSDELINSGDLTHTDDPLINTHVGNATRRPYGAGWIYDRRGAGPVGALCAPRAPHT